MAEYNKQKFYWIKLTDHFLTSDTVDFLLSQKNGANYVVLYQMICLKTVNTNGILARELGEIIVPYDADKIQRDCKHFDIDTVRVALELYKKLGLVYEHSNGILQISDFDRLVGSQTISAEKKAIQIANRCEGGQKGGTKVENIPPEIKILRDKDINIKEIYKENVATAPHTPIKRFIPPSLEEVQAYCKERKNNINAQHFIDFYASKGWKVGNQPMKDWKACIRTWEQKDKGTKTTNFTEREYESINLARDINSYFNEI